ncbi:CBL-interacting protein kinase 24 [Astathelohania contejeani]|uniref:non-specific serine/threonine protein kinase n=1 Tax=Astathelohania contejeani TaxID=164912 RepID=A0ABQ7I254_9MICR|nr:CBL-interacting protein kinase 24 [Thelohania contejeani]
MFFYLWKWRINKMFNFRPKYNYKILKICNNTNYKTAYMIVENEISKKYFAKAYNNIFYSNSEHYILDQHLIFNVLKSRYFPRMKEIICNEQQYIIIMEHLSGMSMRFLSSFYLRNSINTDGYFKQLIKALVNLNDLGMAYNHLTIDCMLTDNWGDLRMVGLSNIYKRTYDWWPQKIFCPPIQKKDSFMAPEMLLNRHYDGMPANIWSCGIIYIFLFLGDCPWKIADLSDINYSKYINGRCLNTLDIPYKFPNRIISQLLKILDPSPKTRMTLIELKNSVWYNSIYLFEHEVQF